MARVAATVAGLAAAVLTVAENSAIPRGVLVGRFAVLAGAVVVLSPAAGWALTAVFLLVVAGGAGVALSWRSSVALLLLAPAALGPMTLTTSTNAERSHDILGDAIAVYGLAALLWLGSTSAVVLHVAQRGTRSATRLRRHSGVAGVCLALVVASGLVTAAVQTAPRDLVGSAYGLLIVASLVRAAGTGLLGHRARIRAADGGPAPRPPCSRSRQ